MAPGKPCTNVLSRAFEILPDSVSAASVPSPCARLLEGLSGAVIELVGIEDGLRRSALSSISV